MEIIISGNDIISRDDNGEIIEEITVEGCPWDAIGMCRGCPVCSYSHDDMDDDDDDTLS